MGSRKRAYPGMSETFAVPPRAPDYADVFTGRLAHPDKSARDLLRHAIANTPRWFHGLFALRNSLVKLVGLKSSMKNRPEGPAINFLDNMPIIEETDQVYASGLADKHLDFLITVEKIDGPKVSFTTQIWFNATLGKLHLIAVLPFHKAIIRHYIRQLGKSR